MKDTVENPVAAVDLAERSMSSCWAYAHDDPWLRGLEWFVARVGDCWDALDTKCGSDSVTTTAFKLRTVEMLQAYVDEIREDIEPELTLALHNLDRPGQ